jgi:hypothetical protein
MAWGTNDEVGRMGSSPVDVLGFGADQAGVSAGFGGA